MNEDSLKLTSYFGERQRTADNGFAADALLDLYGQRGSRPASCCAASRGSAPDSGSAPTGR